jgi:hypothetical protein
VGRLGALWHHICLIILGGDGQFVEDTYVLVVEVEALGAGNDTEDKSIDLKHEMNKCLLEKLLKRIGRKATVVRIIWTISIGGRILVGNAVQIKRLATLRVGQ